MPPQSPQAQPQPRPADPPAPQPVLTPLTTAAIFLVLTVDPGGEDAVRALLPDLAGLRHAIAFRAPDVGLTCVTGIGSDAWDRLFDGPRPAALHPFPEVAGPRHRAPATPGDLLLHIRAARMDVCWELAGRITRRLSGAATVVDATNGFSYYDARDLLGFVDGTENPEGREAAEAVLIGDEDQDFAGGSYVIVQKYLHDLAGWEHLTVDQQERAVGRTKADDIEFDDAAKPADSHVALTSVTGPDGEERQILRFNMPFGRLDGGPAGRGEAGTYFIGYARDPEVPEEMIRNMFAGRGPAAHDRLLDFSTAVTGTLFHVPTADFLADPPPAPAAPVTLAAPAPGAALPTAVLPTAALLTDGSLAIGSLKGTPAP
ncbi:Dyp-type peroxidase [Kitasatospora purpeofusca]|uniref:Dyp-type peroxidase n=1 Tax=Kitasatospora purpeofusca TaxID=67352 RepID=UPI0035DE98EB